MFVNFNTEYSIIKLHIANFIAFNIVNRYFCHLYVPPFP